MIQLKTTVLAAISLLAAMPALAATVAQSNLTSDGGVAAAVIDPNLVNPWGIANAPGGAFWVSDNATGLTTLYDGLGAVQSLVVAIPGAAGPGKPTGQVFNGTTDFSVTEAGLTGVPPFIFASEDGTVSAWAPSVDFPKSIVTIDNSSKAANYKGIAIYTTPHGSTLLVTNFHSGYVEAYDSQYHLLGQFRDQGNAHVAPLPRNYAPYNVAVLDRHIFVTYAKQDADREDSVSAPGAGFVDEVTVTGQLIRRIASHGALNGPWGLAIAPPGFGKLGGALLVGNFGDGTISAYRIDTSQFVGQLRSADGGKLRIDGLWALTQGNGAINTDPAKIYFTSGPQEETHGLFGSLSYVP